MNIPDDVAEEIANSIGTNDPQAVAEELATLWEALENPEQVVERHREQQKEVVA